MLEARHHQLAALNRDRLAPRFPTTDWHVDLARDHALRLVEGEVLERERAAIAWRASTAPTDPEAFVRWFVELEQLGPGQHDPLFPWLGAGGVSR